MLRQSVGNAVVVALVGDEDVACGLQAAGWIERAGHDAELAISKGAAAYMVKSQYKPKEIAVKAKKVVTKDEEAGTTAQSVQEEKAAVEKAPKSETLPPDSSKQPPAKPEEGKEA